MPAYRRIQPDDSLAERRWPRIVSGVRAGVRVTCRRLLCAAHNSVVCCVSRECLRASAYARSAFVNTAFPAHAESRTHAVSLVLHLVRTSCVSVTVARSFRSLRCIASSSSSLSSLSSSSSSYSRGTRRRGSRCSAPLAGGQHFSIGR